jgi:hypothetical protein
MSAEAAYVIEKPHLRPLPDALPPVYELLERVVDLHGYVSVDTNRYSVPERFVGQSVAVYKLPPRSVSAARISRSPAPAADQRARCQEHLARPSYHPGSTEPWHGRRRDLAARPSPQSRPIRCRSQATQQRAGRRALRRLFRDSSDGRSPTPPDGRLN